MQILNYVLPFASNADTNGQHPTFILVTHFKKRGGYLFGY